MRGRGIEEKREGVKEREGECDLNLKKKKSWTQETHRKTKEIYASISDGFSVPDSSISWDLSAFFFLPYDNSD